MWFENSKLKLPTASEALPGRAERMTFTNKHFVLGTPLDDAFAGLETALFGLGCFWGAEKKFWNTPGVRSTAVGYAAGLTPNPTYREVCSGKTGHNEVVRVVFDPQKVSYSELLKVFWESHDPTTAMRQGNDVGTQYRSGVYVNSPTQRELAERSKTEFQTALTASRFGAVPKARLASSASLSAVSPPPTSRVGSASA